MDAATDAATGTPTADILDAVVADIMGAVVADIMDAVVADIIKDAAVKTEDDGS